MNPRKATSLDIPEIKLLWKSVFSDSDDFVNRFITHFGIEHCYVCEINGEIAAMAFALHSQISNLNSQISNLNSLFYVYACATHPQYRRQGIMTKLLETIYNEACRENVAGIFLRAANQNLEIYYRKLGFEEFFYGGRACFKHGGHGGYKEDAEVQFITPKMYSEKRLQKLENYCFVNWGECFFNFLYETGMRFCEYENNIFSVRIEKETLIIDELLGDAPKEEIASLVFKHFSDFKTVEICFLEQKNCCGQIKWRQPFNENPKKGYFAFAME